MATLLLRHFRFQFYQDGVSDLKFEADKVTHLELDFESAELGPKFYEVLHCISALYTNLESVTIRQCNPDALFMVLKALSGSKCTSVELHAIQLGEPTIKLLSDKKSVKFVQCVMRSRRCLSPRCKRRAQ
jgi:hypothetical protein